MANNLQASPEPQDKSWSADTSSQERVEVASIWTNDAFGNNGVNIGLGVDYVAFLLKTLEFGFEGVLSWSKGILIFDEMPELGLIRFSLENNSMQSKHLVESLFPRPMVKSPPMRKQPRMTIDLRCSKESMRIRRLIDQIKKRCDLELVSIVEDEKANRNQLERIALILYLYAEGELFVLGVELGVGKFEGEIRLYCTDSADERHHHPSLQLQFSRVGQDMVCCYEVVLGVGVEHVLPGFFMKTVRIVKVPTMKSGLAVAMQPIVNHRQLAYVSILIVPSNELSFMVVAETWKSMPDFGAKPWMSSIPEQGNNDPRRLWLL